MPGLQQWSWDDAFIAGHECIQFYDDRENMQINFKSANKQNFYRIINFVGDNN